MKKEKFNILCFLSIHRWRTFARCDGRIHLFTTFCTRCLKAKYKSRRCGVACPVFDPSLDTPEKSKFSFLRIRS